MIKASLRGMLGRKLRTGLTAFAVLLGVAMVSGAYIVTDTMLAAADDLESSSYAGVDAAISAKTAFEADTDQGFSEAKPIPARLIQTVREQPEVAVASGEITDSAQLIDRDGDVIGGEGAPTFATGFDATTPEEAALSPFVLQEGRFPQDDDEVAIDAGTAKDENYAIGDQIDIAASGPVVSKRVVGIATFGDVDSIGNATAAIFTLAEAQRLFHKQGEVDSILATAGDGISPEELRATLAGELPSSVQVESAAEQDRFDIGGLRDFLNIIQKVLVAFGGIALFVGAFIIFNTLSITVAQRAREFALMRTIGATRRQVLGSVVLEAVVIGTIGTALGIVAGLGLAAGLNAIFVALGIDLPTSGTVFAARTVILSMIVGIGVTTVAGLAPALRATRVEPVAALREGALPAGSRSRFVQVIAVVTVVIGVALLGYGMFAGGISVGSRLFSLAAGCLVLFVGVALVSRNLVKPLAGVLGRPARRIAGVAGGLARENSMRNPGRTASTAAALMIGLALVTFVAVFGQGLRSSFGSTLEDQLDADYVVTSQDGFTPFPPEAERALGETPGVDTVTPVRADQVQAFGDVENINGIDPATFGEVYNFEWKGTAPDLADLDSDSVIVTNRYAEDHDLAVGDTLDLTTPATKTLHLRVLGIDDRPEFNPLGLADITIGESLFDRSFQTRRDIFVFVNVVAGIAFRSDLEQALSGFPEVKLQTQAAYQDDVEADIDSFLALLYVLLALSVIISLFGIVNTLVLSVFERTRELGMLRAVGMTRRQVRRMIRHESIIVALIGAVLGMAVGVFLAALVTAALSSEGITFALPVGQLIAFVIVAVIAGALAAILPARRASRLDILTALQYE
jgi:putative ABC transport system permease protein